MHLGGPVVPEEYMMYRGKLKGTCANSRTGSSSANFVKSDSKTLGTKQRERE